MTDISSFATTDREAAAALPQAMNLQQAAVQIALGVCEAYGSYNNGNNLPPKLAGYTITAVIQVWEADPNGNPFSGVALPAGSAEPSATPPPRRPAAYAAGPCPQELRPCTGPKPYGTPVALAYQYFGFAAMANDGSHNLLVLRGTVTMEEAVADLIGWGSNTACMLPSQWWFDKKNFGSVNSSLYDFYVGSDADTRTSLAASCMTAIQTTARLNKDKPWLCGGHSLGGAMISLAVLDGVASGFFGASVPTVFTFGSLHVGIADFAHNYGKAVPYSFRVANLCDFVPSMVSLEPVVPDPPYVHVGYEGTFVWQTWDDWGNHSHACIYLPMVVNHWNTILWGPRTYPQKCPPSSEGPAGTT